MAQRRMDRALTRPGRGWVIAIGLLAVLVIFGAVAGAGELARQRVYLGAGLGYADYSGIAWIVGVSGVLSGLLLMAFAFSLELLGRAVLAAEETHAKVTALETEIHELLDRPLP